MGEHISLLPREQSLVHGASPKMDRSGMVYPYGWKQFTYETIEEHSGLDLALGCNYRLDMNVDFTWASHLHGRPVARIMCSLSNLGRTYMDTAIYHVVFTLASEVRATMYEVFVSKLLQLMVVVCVCRSVLKLSPGLTRLNTTGFTIAHRIHSCKLPMK